MSPTPQSTSPQTRRQDEQKARTEKRPRELAARPGQGVGGPPSEPGRIENRAEHQTAHSALICVAAPHLAVSPEHGQLTGQGMEGVYYAGRRVLARSQLFIAGMEPLPLQGRMVSAWRARFVSTARTTPADGPDPAIMVERLRSADGTERITLRNAGGVPARVPLELRLGTDLAEIAQVAVGCAGQELPGSVNGAGLSWTSRGFRARVAADPQPESCWAQLGVLRWDWELPPGQSRTVTLSADLTRTASSNSRPRKNARPSTVISRTARPPRLWHGVRARGDDPRVGALFRVCLDDANALLMADPADSSDLHLVAGVPWRGAFAPVESLRAARMLLPLGTRLAAGTLRTLARGQIAGSGRESGRLPGAMRLAGPYAPPSCTGIEATLLFPALLAEACRWGLPASDAEELLPAARRALQWMLRAVEQRPYLPDPVPDGPYRCEVQAGAYRAALLGAELLDAHGCDGGGELKEWASALRGRFRKDFWSDDDSGGRPVALRTRKDGPVAYLGCAAVELLDTGLPGAGGPAEGLLTEEQTQQLARLLAGPSLNSGWGLRSLDCRDARYNPFGHRSGAVRLQESVTAVTGLARSGHEREAGALLRGIVDAAGRFGLRLPEMYAAEQRSRGGLPVPHPAACRPAAVAATGGIQLLLTLAGLHANVPEGTLTLRPLTTVPLGAVEFAGLRVAGEPFSVRVTDKGKGEVSEIPGSLRLAD
ncbi:Glycogen debranching enzyme (alpha-1,6-glucosidase) [Streptomyces sp. WMMB 714]|nr:Glycogen debranching enzyme (alpha-1,6-glucosidase) [Streptomyces sp. WMMB 714]